MSFNSSAKKIGAVFCAAVMLMVVAQSVVSNENQKPIAIAGNDVFVDIGVTVGFDGRQSYDPDDLTFANSSEEPRPLNFTWNFQDGMVYGAQSIHAFETAGVYLVILMVRDYVGAAGFDALTVTVRNTPPVAIAEVNETAYEDEILVFNGTKSTDNYTDMPSLEYYWDFGDGISANGSVVNHTYARSGTYISTLKVVDGDGAMDINFTKINVTNLPPVGGKQLNKTVLEDHIVSFSPAVFDTISDQPLLKYQWNFGDGTATEGRIVEHIYTKSGTYEASLTVTDDNGAQCSDTFFVFVENFDPQVEIKNITETIYEGGTYVFESVGNDSSGDYPLLNYTNDNNRFGWRTTNLWEDDWTGNISCQIVDDDGSISEASETITVENTDPEVSVVDAYLIADITLRAAGEKWHDVDLYLNESGTPRKTLDVYREPGDPKEQEDTEENVKFTLAEEWQVSVHYTPLDDPINGQINGATPVWILLEFDNGANRKIPHTFNVQDPANWTWNLSLNKYFFLPIDDPECNATGGNPTMHFEYWVFDAGKDDETVTWDFGEATMTQSFGAATFPTEIVSTIDYTPTNLSNIIITAVDDDGGSGTDYLYFTDNILDNIAPKAYASGDTEGTEDSTAYFSGSGTDSVSDVGNLNYNWRFGEGSTASGASAQHIYENEGTYMVILEVTDGTDSTFDAYFIDISNTAPVAVPDIENSMVFEDDIVRFNGSLSSDTPSDMDSLLYSWSFSGLANRPEIVVEHTYSFAGSYDVDLTVLDDNGAFGTDTITIDVENVVPSAKVVDNLTVNEDQTAFLSCEGIDTISDRPLLDYNWTFGTSYNVTIVNQTVTTTVVVVNGTNVTRTNITYNNETYSVTPYGLGWNPTFIYNQSGEYYPEVNVTDDDGDYSLVSGNITVVNVPPVAFAGNDMKVFAGITNISFNAIGIDTYSDIDSLRYYWDFGNGNYSDLQNAVYAYTKDGNYTVNLTVTDNDGAIANHSINVTVRIDSDGDGMPDVWEIMHGLNHLDPTGENGANGDPDDDFLVNLQEYYYGLHPKDDDTDDDGILDGIEDFNRNGIVDDWETDPLNHDTDDDGLNDGLEIGLVVAQGGDTAGFWFGDVDPDNT
ncbi:MAG TPA: hypothetical protein DCY35_05230, partial [Prolixibacteraceae bacterium]|nr:hypothetical protein [Prolixibacteraceae bacterium]